MAMKISTKYFWLGVLTMALGAIVLLNAVIASLAVVIVTGVILLLGGASQIALGFWAEGLGTKVLTWGLGVLTTFLGWSFMANPLAGIVSLSTLVLIIMAASGIVQILFAFRVRGTRFFWLLLLTGSVSVVLAIIILSSPGATLALLGTLLGVQMLSAGASLTTMGMFFKETRH
jgi:membrane protein HdeD